MKKPPKVFDTESFIRECILKFGNDRFDYSKVDYVSAKTEVKIRCLKHDLWFEAQPYTHRQGKGSCPSCRVEVLGQYNKMSVEDFVRKANKVHSNYYSYGKTINFKNMHENVVITCPIHGDFLQTPTNHVHNAFGCSECAITERSLARKLSQEDVLLRFRERHGDKYCYSEVEYDGIYSPVKILCKEHNHWFLQKPTDHFNGTGCKFCANKSRSLNNTGTSRGVKTTEDFIKDATIVHGDVYGYDSVEYKGVNSKLTILCNTHGYFEQTADKHLSGRGCPICGKIKASVNNRTSLGEFIDECNRKHNNYYNYSEVKFDVLSDKIIIGCPEHGKFLQKASDHKYGKACKKCTSSGGYDRGKSGYFYILKVTKDVIKFGITGNIATRFKAINDYSIHNIEILHCFSFEDGNIPADIESEVKRILDSTNIINKTEMYSGHTETTHLYNLPLILSIVEKYKPD